ncbi:hypothetical protein EJV47_17820 [Hymenobacter gummosus]|uniref:Uncharacterized protein n=1 Tax=Hymenobacter gummosus TaxID=1776032 RepID=A0A3S0H7L4_9BACT|nr:hypothetical protein [Hymenobacter gummosus]RTQ47779.1 hypothetical protein EJV47_17820 [Hymenobacter gummosus]
MPLYTCRAQSRPSLTDFYSQLLSSDDAHTVDVGAGMLTLLELVHHAFPLTPIWGLTSLYQLHLLAHDDDCTPWYVAVAAAGRQEYWLEYLLPAAEAPWPGAFVRGRAHSLPQVLEYLRTAMRRSGGWPHSPELGRGR